MSMEQLEKRLERSKRWLMFFAGTTLVMLAWAITDVPSKFSYFWGYYILWFIFQVTTPSAGFVMFTNQDWRELPLAQRLDTAFGYLGLSWFLFLAFLIKSNCDEPQPFLWGGSVTLLLYALVLGAGITLVLSYWALRRTRPHSPEEMFP